MKIQSQRETSHGLVAVISLFVIILNLSLTAECIASTGSTTVNVDVKTISKASGTKASRQKDGVVKISWARTDVPVIIDGERFPPAAGLGSWAAFAPTSKGAMVMGDTVVFEDEVDAAMDAAFAHGLRVTALHNHFFFSKPPVFFMHIAGDGDPTSLARGVKAVWDAIHVVRERRAQPATYFSGGRVHSGRINDEEIAKIIGKPVTNSKGVIKVAMGRNVSINGVTIDGSMGVSTWAAFVGSDKLATIDGDFVMTANEAQAIFQSLRKVGIHIVAIHTHMMGETPTLYFMHFWGKGTPQGLARGFKAALDAQAMADKK